MNKLILVLLAFFAIFTFLRNFEVVVADEIPVEIPVEIAH